MDYNSVINISKICRICLDPTKSVGFEENSLTSLFNTEFAMIPAEMLMLCAKVKVKRADGLPEVICSNCIYRLGAAYHFKQQCENSDFRLRSYLGILDDSYGTRDNETNTEPSMLESAKDEKFTKTAKRYRSTYKRKNIDECKKRGPKAQIKVPQTCYECHKTFKSSALLTIHIRTHTGEKPFMCRYQMDDHTTCMKRFAQKHNLEIHIRSHLPYRERPYVCEVCSKQFAALGNFEAHRKIHSGLKNHICSIITCNKRFLTAGDLSRHQKTHSGIKPFSCEVCGKSFTRNRDMVAHKKKIHLSNNNERDGNESDVLSLNAHYRTHTTSTAFHPTALMHHLNHQGTIIHPSFL